MSDFDLNEYGTFEEHDFRVLYDYPGRSPGGKLWLGHYYKCPHCDVETLDPSFLHGEERVCAALAS